MQRKNLMLPLTVLIFVIFIQFTVGLDNKDTTLDPTLYDNRPRDPTSITDKPPVSSPKPSIPCFNGCITDHTCLPFGTRLVHEGKASYCNIDGNIEPQLSGDAECMNHYECESNVCVNNQCVSAGFIQKIINWFARLFGGG